MLVIQQADSMVVLPNNALNALLNLRKRRLKVASSLM